MSGFDPHCCRCPRLVAHLRDVHSQHPDYHCAPVAPFGDPQARLLIVGLAPGTHGANASGRPFTGDHAGILLYQTLHRFGFASAAVSSARDDNLLLHKCRITNAVKCLPPENRPNTDEIRRCNDFLKVEIDTLPTHSVLLALGAIAHGAILRALGLTQKAHRFGHAAEFRLGPLRLLDSYHCSRYNTQTGRLTEEMFGKVFERARALLAKID
jgi:uracil-DNA glycosylase family 4